MKKAKFIGLLGAISFMLAIAIMPAFSTPMTSGSYSIPSLTISSGGHTGLQSGSYKLQDIKGQAIIGSGSSASYGLGLGGVYGTLGAGEGGVTAWGSDPHVQNLRIRRNGNNIEVYWDTDAPTSTFYVFRRRGVFENASINWDDGINNGSSTIYIDRDQVGTGLDQIYYRVLSVNSKSDLVNKIAVGKINLRAYYGWNFVGLPFEPTGDKNNSLGVNLADNEQLWSWDPTLNAGAGDFKTPVVNFSGGSWGSGFNLEKGEGYLLNIIQVPTSGYKTLTFIGNVNSSVFIRSVKYGWNLIANPYSKNLSGNSGFITGRSAASDQTWEWDAAVRKDFDMDKLRTFNGVTWDRAPNLEIGKGYGYNHVGTGFDWQLLPNIY